MTAPSGTSSSTARLRYHGSGGSLLGLLVVNAILTAITVGIYGFWGRNKVRQFHYSNTEMDGDRFQYHGTGGELFIGYLKLVGVMFATGIVYFVGVMLVTWLVGRRPGPALMIGLQLALYALIGIVMAIAINGARRYRLSRSSLRGVRFAFVGDVEDYVMLILKGTLLSIVTLGFYGPSFSEQRRAFLVNNARYGSEPFKYEDDARALFKEYVKALLLAIPTLGLYSFWYSAYRHRHQWSRTTMRGARFQNTVTGGGLLSLTLTNALLIVCTLGIGTPWVITRTMRYHLDNLWLAGTVDWAAINQRPKEAGGVLGEGVADGFNLDVGIGL